MVNSSSRFNPLSCTVGTFSRWLSEMSSERMFSSPRNVSVVMLTSIEPWMSSRRSCVNPSNAPGSTLNSAFVPRYSSASPFSGLRQRPEHLTSDLVDEVPAQIQHPQLVQPVERPVRDRTELVVVQVQLEQLLLVHEDTLRDAEQMVVAQVEHRQLGVEPNRRVDRLDPIELDHQPTDRRVERDRQHVQLAFAARHVQLLVVTHAPVRAVRNRTDGRHYHQHQKSYQLARHLSSHERLTPNFTSQGEKQS
uniref:Uncharacterized protein n=1 Tax=Anopheles farauti TaxID=69004 RepID=A0A182QL33_9DIPT